MDFIKSNHHYFYLLLAILGGGYTYYYMLQGLSANGGNFNIGDFVSSTWTADNYAKSLTLDFWTGAIAGTFFVIFEGIRLKMKRVWLYPLLIVFVAFAFGFPLFLFLRGMHLKKFNDLID
jgi:hypothetical protein